MTTLIWLVISLSGALYLAYQRVSLRAATLAAGAVLVAYTLLGDGATWWLVLVCGLTYGAVMGSFGGRPAQAAISAVKVPLLLAATTALSLPSFFVLNTLLGVRRDFGVVLRALVGASDPMTAKELAAAAFDRETSIDNVRYHIRKLREELKKAFTFDGDVIQGDDEGYAIALR